MDALLIIDPRLIAQFAVIAEEASFTRAAVRLGVAQPWLSARLRKLEDQIGFSLFSRNTRNVSLTDQGQEFLKAARGVLASIQSAQVLAERLRKQEGRRLRVGSSLHGALFQKRKEIIERFLAGKGDLDVELDIGWTPSLLKRLRAGELDVAFIAGPIEEVDIESVSIGRSNLSLLTSKNNPVARLKVLQPAHLAGQTIATFPRRAHPVLFDHLYMPLQVAGAKLLEVSEPSDDLFDQVRASGQLIVSYFDSLNMKQNINRSGIVRKTLGSARIHYLLARRRGHSPPMIEALWEMVR